MTSPPRPRATLARLRASTVGALAEGTLRADESIEAVVTHLVEGLDALSARSLVETLPEHETGLTQTLVTELESRVGYRPYFFQQEYAEDADSGRSPRVDVAVQARGDHPSVLSGVLRSGGRFFALEAKRLPTPGTGREREYLTGARGAMERFKQGIHGAGLHCVGIIGYVQQNEFLAWRDTINSWVDELRSDAVTSVKWDEQDKLQLEVSSSCSAQLRSMGRRWIDDVQLTIRHVWVLLGKRMQPSGRSKPRAAKRERPTAKGPQRSK